MCRHGTVVQMPLRGRVQDIDACIAHIVAALNAGGVSTVASCCGHKNPFGTITLADGRELLVIRDFKSTRRAEKLLFANRRKWVGAPRPEEPK